MTDYSPDTELTWIVAAQLIQQHPDQFREGGIRHDELIEFLNQWTDLAFEDSTCLYRTADFSGRFGTPYFASSVVLAAAENNIFLPSAVATKCLAIRQANNARENADETASILIANGKLEPGHLAFLLQRYKEIGQKAQDNGTSTIAGIKHLFQTRCDTIRTACQENGIDLAAAQISDPFAATSQPSNPINPSDPDRTASPPPETPDSDIDWSTAWITDPNISVEAQAFRDYAIHTARTQSIVLAVDINTRRTLNVKSEQVEPFLAVMGELGIVDLKADPPFFAPEEKTRALLDALSPNELQEKLDAHKTIPAAPADDINEDPDSKTDVAEDSDNLEDDTIHVHNNPALAGLPEGVVELKEEDFDDFVYLHLAEIFPGLTSGNAQFLRNELYSIFSHFPPPSHYLLLPEINGYHPIQMFYPAEDGSYHTSVISRDKIELSHPFEPALHMAASLAKTKLIKNEWPNISIQAEGEALLKTLEIFAQFEVNGTALSDLLDTDTQKRRDKALAERPSQTTEPNPQRPPPPPLTLEDLDSIGGPGDTVSVTPQGPRP